MRQDQQLVRPPSARAAQLVLCLAEAATEALEALLASRETFTLGEIDDALRRLYRHPERFGRDEVTGEPIAFARLDLIPWARRSAA